MKDDERQRAEELPQSEPTNGSTAYNRKRTHNRSTIKIDNSRVKVRNGMKTVAHNYSIRKSLTSHKNKKHNKQQNHSLLYAMRALKSKETSSNSHHTERKEKKTDQQQSHTIRTIKNGKLITDSSHTHTCHPTHTDAGLTCENRRSMGKTMYTKL